ncbi:MAG: hypothetical protein JWR69_776 [Pedosphaera sp.]|nr:hypothetical protein [Pedosphaera sp.]
MNSGQTPNVKRGTMKKPILLGLAAVVVLVAVAQAGEGRSALPASPPPAPEPVPVYDGNPQITPPTGQSQQQPVPPPTGGQSVYVYDQKPLQVQPALIPPEEAQAVVDQFRTNYPKMNGPRILIYVNSELVDEQTGMKLSGRSETVETKTQSGVNAAGTNASANGDSTTTKSVVKNNYHNQTKTGPTLADRQTVRDVERLFGRPLRLGGAVLVDQRLATQLIGDRPLKDLAAGTEGQQASKDCEAISKIADVVLEVLISSKSVTVSEVSGDRNYTVPDIQATAIRLKDAKVIGQASASEVMGRNHSAGSAARLFGVQDISEATALALMEDILQGAQ